MHKAHTAVPHPTCQGHLLLWCVSCTAGRAIKSFALCLFRYNQQDLEAFHRHKKAADPSRFGNTAATQLVNMLPLSAMKQHVRREYFDGALQAENMQRWYEQFLVDPQVAVDLEGRHLVSGGPDGLKAFNRCWESQMDLVLRQKMSGKFSHQQLSHH